MLCHEKGGGRPWPMSAVYVVTVLLLVNLGRLMLTCCAALPAAKTTCRVMDGDMQPCCLLHLTDATLVST